MSSQIIKKKLCNSILFNLLDTICIKKENYYIFNNDSYKRGCLLEVLTPFLVSLEEYYYKSKLYYLQRKLSFNHLATIIRQICKKNNIVFTSKIKYISSAYNIIYYIYY
tara:strand:+ start:2375 stop:2701 length:327 start_codon:yes stop_codon:yes gene_type:complete